MTEDIIAKLAGLAIGSLVALPIVIWGAQRFSRYYANPPVATRGGVVYMYLVLAFVVWPALILSDIVDFSKFQFLLPVVMAGLIGLIFGLLLLLLDRSGALAKLPFVGRSFNAYLLALARANLERVQKNVRRYEEIDAMFVTTAKA